MDENNVILNLKNIRFSYLNGPTVLDGLDFTLKKGEKIGLVGHNGSGKTTFLHVVMGILKASSGELRIFGNRIRTEKDFATVRQKIGFLFQNPDDQLFSPTVLEDVAFGPLNLGKSPQEARDASIKILRELNLEGFEDRVTYKLSGGEKKLVALATVLVMEPEVLLLDEPTTALDELTRERIIGILNGLDISLIIVSHEFDFLAETTGKISVIRDGRIAGGDDSDIRHSHFHKHPIGKHHGHE